MNQEISLLESKNYLVENKMNGLHTNDLMQFVLRIWETIN